jgi:cytochrome c oxidase assembly protein subunit 15
MPRPSGNRMSVRTSTYKPALFWLCLGALAWCVPVLLAGGWTTSINAGMAFLDWPLSNGSVNPEGFLVEADQTAEHSHRLAASTLGLLSLIIAFVTHRVEARAGVRKLAYGLVAFVIFQGLLGGGRVLFDPANFKDLTSTVSRTFAIAHAVTALLTAGILAALVVVQSRRWLGEAAEKNSAAISPALRRLAVATATGVWIQSLLGALVRQHRWSIWDMAARPADANPASYLGEWATGKFLAQMSSGWPFALNVAHRAGALVVAGLVATLVTVIFMNAAARKTLGGFAALLAGVTLFQIVLGVTQIWFNANTAARNAHHLGGAVVFCVATALAMFAYRAYFAKSEASE